MFWNALNLLSRAIHGIRALLLATTCLLALGVKAQLTVSSQTDLQQLAQSITGPGVAISNPQITCHASGYGEFNYSGSALDVEHGVILTSGTINNALGPNNAGNKSFQASTPGNNELEVVTGRNTFDACSFEFDIIPSGDSIRFDFVFGSEEYNEWVGSQFNDVFGFFISGPGITGDPGIGADHNIALVPGTSTAVAINNINNGSNQSYYHDNAGGSVTQYDGYTTGLSARSAVTPCETYHLKLVVADASDKKLDSGVLINQVSSNEVTMSSFTASGIPELIEGCNPGWVRFTRSNVSALPLTLTYYLSGTATNGTDYSAIGNVNPMVPKTITIPAGQAYVDRAVDPLPDVINDPGEYLQFILGNPFCPAVQSDTLIFPIEDTLFATASPGGTICAGGSWPLTVTGGTSYSWSPATGLSCTTCANPIASPASTTTYSVVVTHGTCSRTFNRQVRVSQLSVSGVRTHPLCAGNANGAINITLSGAVAPITYAWTGPNGFTASSEDINFVGAGTYTVTVVDAACTVVQSFNLLDPAPLNVSLAPSVLAFGQNIACFGSNSGSIDATITGGTGAYSVNWSGPNGFVSSAVDISSLAAGTYTINVIDANGCTASANTTLTESPGLSASATVTDPILCVGVDQGAASASGSGGMPPYSYSWNTPAPQNTASATGLNPGSYTVTITDSYGCSANANVTLGSQQPLSIALTAQTQVACHGASTGSATVAAAGGTGAYTYGWNSAVPQNTATASGLVAGNYTATVTDANGCQTSVDVTITQPATPLAASVLTQQNVSCFGANNGSATISASGGTGAFTYLWNTIPVQNTATASNLPAGNYTCNVQDVNGCSQMVNVTITQPAAALTAAINAQTNISCNDGVNGDATVTVNGGTEPYSYSWNSSPVQTATTATGLHAGAYTVTITDANGCSAQASTTLTEPDALAITGNVTAANCQGAADGAIDASVTGGTGAYTYAWTGPGGFTASTQDIASLIAGGYVLVVTDANGCQRTTSFNVNQPGLFAVSSSVSDHNGSAVSCAASNDGSIDLTVSGATAPYTFAWSGPNAFTAATEDINALSAGTYVVNITDANGCNTSENITLTAPATLSIALATATNISCAGGSNGAINATINGGTGPFTFSWTGPGAYTSASEDISGLAAGAYSLTVLDANNCSALASHSLVAPSAVNASLVGTIAQTCFGIANGQATVNASGGTAPYTYSWNTVPMQSSATASGLIAGNYVATATDALGCTATLNVSVSGPSSALVLNTASITNVLCYDDSSGVATVIATGGQTPYTYSWNTMPVQTGATANALPAGTWTATVSDALGCSTSINVHVQQPIVGISAFVENIGHVSCFGGSDGFATMEVSGGSGSYTMEWNTVPAQFGPTATGLAPGWYWLTITDNNGCDTPKQFPAIITGPSAPLAITSSTTDYNGYAVSCPGANDGGINAVITGGTPGYTSVWSGPNGYTGSTEDIYGLEAGSYELTVTDANGCVTDHLVAIASPAALSATANITTAACAGASNGAVDITVSNGVAPYDHIWNGPNGFSALTQDITGVPAGVYNVHVTDANGCSNDFSFDVNQPGVFTVNAALSAYNGDQVSCAGSTDGAIDVTASGGTLPYSFSWSGPNGYAASTEDITALSAGAYALTITDANGCSALATYTLNAPAPLSATLNAAGFPGGGNVSCAGSTDGAIDATISGGHPTYTISWSGPNGFTSANEDINNLAPGTYTIDVTDANGCTAAGAVTLDAPTPVSVNAVVSEYNSGDEVSCNGASTGVVDLTINGGLAPYTVAWTGPNGFTSNAIDLNGIAAGTYDATITDAAGCTAQTQVTLTEPTPIAINANSPQVNGYEVACQGASTGSIDIDVTGGAGVYNYQWSGPNAFASSAADQSGLVAGTYTVTITDLNGCTADLNVTLNEPAAISASGAITTAGCSGSNTGAVDLTIAGGVAPFAVQWSGPGGYTNGSEDISALFAGIYNASITDASGCTFAQNFSVSEPGLFQVSALATTYPGGYGVSCAGQTDGAIDVTITGGTPPLFFIWSGPNGFSANTEDISGLAAGVYDLAISDANGCSFLASWTLTAPTPVNLGLAASQFAGGSNLGCAGGTNGSIDAVITGGVTPYTIAWNGPNGFTSISEDITDLEAGSYAIQVVDAIGCTNTATIDLIGPDPMDLQLSASTFPSGGNVSCVDAQDGSIDLTLSGGSVLYFIDWTGPNGYASNNEDISGLEAGTYDVLVTDANGCEATASITLAPPTAIDINLTTSQFSGGFEVNCNGSSTGSIDATVQGGMGNLSYQWTGPNGFTSNTADINGLIAGDYTITVTDDAGCSASETLSLNEPTQTAINATLSDAGNGYEVSCNGNDGAIYTDISGGLAPYTFDWNGTGGFASTNEDLTGLAAGVYTVTVIDVNGCSLDAQFELDQADPLTTSLVITGNVCDGLDDGAIDLSVSGGVAPYDFSWNGPNGFSGTNEDLAQLAGGDYAVLITDAAGCTAQTSATIAASSPIDVSVYTSDYGNVNIPCVGDSTGVIEVTISGGHQPLTIEWTGPNGFNATDVTGFSALIAGDYHVTITDGNGCSTDSTITLTEPTAPLSATLTAATYPSGTNVSCFGATDGSIDLTMTGGSAPYTFNWHGADSAAFDTEDIAGLSAGTYDVVVTDDNGCSFFATTTLVGPDTAMSAQVTVSTYAGGYNTSCNGANNGTIAVVITGDNGGSTLAWSGPNGFTSTADSLSGLEPGNYILTVTDMNGCMLSQAVPVFAPDPIAVGFEPSTFNGGTHIACAGGTDGTLFAQVSGGAGPMSLAWTGPNGFTANTDSLVGLGAGEYCVSITDANGCTGNGCFELIAPQPLQVSTTASPAFCNAGNGAVDGSISGGVEPYTILWSNGAQTEDLINVAADTYTINVTDLNGCTASATATVEGSSGINASAQVSDVLCAGNSDGSIDLTVIAGTAPFTFDWSNNADTEDIGGLQANSYSVTITDALGCTWSDLFTVGAPEPIGADTTLSLYDNGFNVSTVGGSDGSIAVEALGGTAPYTYAWSNGGTSPLQQGLMPGTYTVTITDANGCTLALEVLLDGPNGIELPTGFTPNRDGANDAFVIHGLEGYRSNHLTVFNRWGNKVYDRLNYTNDWEGENQMGDMLPNGTYFIILELNEGEITIQNYVDLRR